MDNEKLDLAKSPQNPLSDRISSDNVKTFTDAWLLDYYIINLPEQIVFYSAHGSKFHQNFN